MILPSRSILILINILIAKLILPASLLSGLSTCGQMSVMQNEVQGKSGNGYFVH